MTSAYRFRCVITVAALTTSAFSEALAQNWVSNESTSTTKNSVAMLGDVDWNHWETVRNLLSDIHVRTGIPALAAACVRNGRIVDYATVGTREYGRPSPVAEDDRFHLGSVTKSMTATIIGKLVEQGVLSWETKIGDVLGDIVIHKGYGSVTIEDLLQHRAGLPSYTSGLPEAAENPRDYRGSATEIRAAFVAVLLIREPVGRPGESFLYSNAGYSVAGLMAERSTGKSWEQLVNTHVFDALGMENGGFGFPEQPAGHRGEGPQFTPTPRNQYPPMDMIAPAGNVHCSVRDLARYAMFHLAGLSGKDGYLRSETVKRLHTAPGQNKHEQYASGWFIRHRPDGEEVHSHAGTVGSSYAEIKLLPASGTGVVVLLNVGRAVAEPFANKIGRALLDRFRRPSSDRPKTLAEKRGDTRFAFSRSEKVPLARLGAASPKDDARVWKVIKRLADAFNDEDVDDYMSLFPTMSHAGALDRRSMFDFMAGQVMPTRGNVKSFHALSPSVKIPDSQFPVRTLVFHFENGFPGYLGLSLDEAGKIDHFSLFVKPDLCPNGVDPLCSKITTTVGRLSTP